MQPFLPPLPPSPTSTTSHHHSTCRLYACLGAFVFSFILIIDTQMVVGSGRLKLGTDEYVYAVLSLYLDVVQLFLMMLQLFGMGERR